MLKFSATNDSIEREITAIVFVRGVALGTWTGTSYEYSKLNHEFQGTQFQLSVIKNDK